MGMVIAIVVGALAGLSAGGAGAALIGGFVGWLVVRVLRQQEELEGLKKQIDGLEWAATPLAGSVSGTASARRADGPALAPTIATPVAPLTPSLPIAAEGDATPANEPEPQPDRGPDTVPTPLAVPPTEVPIRNPRPPLPPVPSSEPSPALLAIQAWLFGGNTIVKAGIGILFIGLAFLARYATEHVQIAVEWRLAAIAAVAIVLLVLGWRLRLTRAGYAQVLQGGAVAVLYLTIFTAFRYYGVLAALPAFAGMVAVALLAAALAVLQDARSLAVIGALGGFATPLLVSTGSNNIVGLLTYYFILDAGIAVVAWFKTWRALNLIGFVATFSVSAAWGATRYQPSSFAVCEAFLIAFFLLFVVILMLPARRPDDTDAGSAMTPDRWVSGSLLFGLPAVVFGLQMGMVHDTPFGGALSALALAASYVALALWMRGRPTLGLTFEASLGIATVFLTLVIPLALDARSTAGAWSLEGAALVWLGFRQQRGWPRGFGYALLLIAGVAMLLGHERFGLPRAVFNAYLFNGLIAAGAAIAAALFVHRHADGARSGAGIGVAGEALLEPVLIGLATLWLIAAATLEIDAFVSFQYVNAASIVAVSAVAVVYALLATRLDWTGIALPTIAHAPLLFLFAAADALDLAQPAANGGWWAWPIGFAAHALLLWLAAPRWPALAAHVAHALGAITLALLGALLGRALTAGWGDAESAWPWLGWLVAPALLLLLLPRPGAARRWPVRALPAAYQRSACAALAAGLWVWTLVANIACDGSAAPLPHLPLLNPLDIGIAFALLTTFLWLRRADAVSRWSLGLGGVAGFVWLNAMLVRAFHHYAGVPYRVDAWMSSLAVQTGITLLWTVLALVAMWLAARRTARWPWIAGATLLAAVVIKLLLVDLSGSGSVTRIVSFIGVGALMLLIGYVAPLPAREANDATA